MSVKHCLAIMALSAALLPAGAFAQDDSQAAATRLLQKQMNVLQVDPDKASSSCIDALKDMHKTQDMIAKLETKSTPGSDLDVARDVLGSDMESALQMCGADAATMCRTGKPSAALTKACTELDAPDRSQHH